MDNDDRTCPTPFEIPNDVLPMLRRAAHYGFELVGDPMGSWGVGARDGSQVLDAARTVDLFRFGKPDARDVAELADKALRWAEPPSSMPTTAEELDEHLGRLGELSRLIKVRDDALRHMGHAMPDDGADDETAA